MNISLFFFEIYCSNFGEKKEPIKYGEQRHWDPTAPQKEYSEKKYNYIDLTRQNLKAHIKTCFIRSETPLLKLATRKYKKIGGKVTFFSWPIWMFFLEKNITATDHTK